jgi:trehalose/maltose hydrolase-like predicted phosphorylase
MQTHKLNTPIAGAPSAYLANGLIGLRIAQIPLPSGTALVNGYVGLSPEKRSEEYADAPYPVGADIQMDQVWLSERPDLVTFVSQEVDFACGELRSTFRLAVGGTTAEIDVLTFCSRTQPGLVLQEIVIRVDQPCSLVLQAHLDWRGLEGNLGYRCMPDKHQDAIVLWESRGALATIGASYISEFTGDDLKSQCRNAYGHEEDMALTRYTVDAKPGKTYRLRQIGALVPSLMHGEPHWHAARLARAGTWSGFDQIRADNRAAWAELWKSRPVLVGAEDRWQQLADACFFYLHSSVHRSSPCSIAPFGLSRRIEYSGHVFWDTETFMYPGVLLSNPGAAKSMMHYRANQLPWARAHAQLNGYDGIQFPWQTGNHGFEVSPYYTGACGGMKEEHINLDVAFAMAQYVHASGDDLFFRQQAWPVIQGVAEWIASRVIETERGYEIQHITGIDEGRDNVDNDAETNGLAAVVLREAVGFAQRLGVTPPAAWSAIAERLFIPIDAERRIVRKNDRYDLGLNQACPDTMMLTFPFAYPLANDVHKATVAYNLEHAHTYLGMPMNSANFAVWACRAGEREKAIEFIEAGMMSRVVQPYWQLVESTRQTFGVPKTVFVTACGAFMTAVLQGLTGIHLDSGDPQGWAKHPITLPAGWEAIEVEQFWAHGEPMRLTARHGAKSAELKG